MNDLSSQVAATLREAISTGRLAAGAKLKEREIAEAWNTSRAVARQALIRLSEEGLTTVVPNRGAFVASPSFKDAIELFDALTFIEQGVLDRSADFLGTVAWQDLKEYLIQERAIAEELDVSQEPDVTAGFHTRLVSLTNNEILCEFHKKLVNRAVLLNQILSWEWRSRDLLYDHAEICKLVEEKQIDEAKALLQRHYSTIARAYNFESTPKPAGTFLEAIEPLLEA